jgi:DNA polymerase V
MFALTILGPATDYISGTALPMVAGRIRAGFPSPADDCLEKNICLQDLLIEHPAATFLVKVEGHSMRDAGIFDGDLAVVDRAVTAAHGKIVVAVIDGEFTLKRLSYRGGSCFLESANDSFAPIEVSDCSDNCVWGVVTSVIHRL